jgi:nitroreductase
MSRFVPLQGYCRLAAEDMLANAREFADHMARRRTVRDFAPDPVQREVIEAAIRAAGSAPSGANRQPWHFVAVSDANRKRAIREGAEAEEREFYAHRASADWLDALAPLGVDANKPFLETAPWLIAIFSQKHSVDGRGEKLKNYYPVESTGIATGLLIAALHRAGLATLTHTPSPMKFLNHILDRPDSEKPFLLLVVGHPAAGAKVPDIGRKAIGDIATFLV